jgi:hypothetical protein
VLIEVPDTNNTNAELREKLLAPPKDDETNDSPSDNEPAAPADPAATADADTPRRSARLHK